LLSRRKNSLLSRHLPIQHRPDIVYFRVSRILRINYRRHFANMLCGKHIHFNHRPNFLHCVRNLQNLRLLRHKLLKCSK